MFNDVAPQKYDVLIAGGGPAGLAAALTLGRMRRRVLVCDTRQGRNATVLEAHNFFTRDAISPAELLQIGREQLRRYPSVQVDDVAIHDIRQDSDGFAATLSDGRNVTARRVLLATGLMDELPPVEGLREVWGRTAFNCPYCDGWETQGKRVAVLADGNGALHLALMLHRFTPDLVVCTNGADDVDDDARKMLSERGIGLRSEPVIRVDHTDGEVRGLTFASDETLPCDVVFVAAPFRQRSDLAARLGCAFFEDGTVEVDDFGQTTVSGVYAAGDMARRAAFPGPLAQLMFAAAAGQLAAVSIDRELMAADVPGFPGHMRRVPSPAAPS